jgi:hypothetical protein
MNTEYFWWLAILVGVAAGGLVVVLGWRDRGGLDALAARADGPSPAAAGEAEPAGGVVAEPVERP